jgi:hypothetical protein
MEREEFVNVAEEALDSLPEEFRSRIQNVAILVEDLPSNQSTPPAGAEEAIASRHFPRRPCNEEERFQPPHRTGSHRALSEKY